jgi:glucose/arabinose dehydrogenase
MFWACSPSQTPEERPAAGAQASDASSGRPGGESGSESSAEGGRAGAGPLPSPNLVDFLPIDFDLDPAQATDFAFYPDGSGDLLMLAKTGELRRYQLAGNAAQLLASWSLPGIYDRGDCGAISLAFDVTLAEDPYVYVAGCTSVSESKIFRVSLDSNGDVIQGSEIAILSVGNPASTQPQHNVGSIGFEPTGVLWALFGDKGLGEPAGQPDNDLGKLLRVIPSRTPELGGYEPAPGNHAAPNSSNPNMFALGLRSPFRGTRDARGFFWIGDVGSDFYEEINIIRDPGANLGWPKYEGPCQSCNDALPPALYWDQSRSAPYAVEDAELEDTNARVAWVGPEVETHDPDRYGGGLAGSVIFGDYCGGFLRHARIDDDGRIVLDQHLGHLANASALRQRDDGFVYAVTFGRCESNMSAEGDSFSRLFRMVLVEAE